MATMHEMTEFDRNGEQIATLRTPARLETIRSIAREIIKKDEKVAYITITEVVSDEGPSDARVEYIQPGLPW